MTEQQYRRVNRMVFPLISVILGYIALTLVAFLVNKDSVVTWRTYVQLVAAVLGILSCFLWYKFKGNTERCGKAMMGTGALIYMLVRLVGTSEESFSYAFPILIASMAYLNVRLVIWGNAVLFSVNVIHLLINISMIATPQGSGMVMNLLISLLVAYASIKITSLLKIFSEENIETIRESAQVAEDSQKAGLLVADNIITHFNDAMGMIDTLEQSLATSNFSMNNIAESTESTAEAIQNQATMCQNILERADRGGAVANEMIGESTKVETTVGDGVEIVSELRKQADNVAETNATVVEVIDELTNKVHEVESFVDTILNISSQTNLLALNASIEAARAGAAGKGFAVVAEEIRKLSEETQVASNNITDIIQALNADTRRANESIEQAVSSVKRQNELIEDTNGKFAEVASGVTELVSDINQMGTIMNETVDSSNVIFDNISQLSATSEEVASSSNEGLSNSQITVTEIGKCKNILQSIFMLAEDLQRSLKG